MEQQDARQDWQLENAVQRVRGAELWPLLVPPNYPPAQAIYSTATSGNIVISSDGSAVPTVQLNVPFD